MAAAWNGSGSADPAIIARKAGSDNRIVAGEEPDTTCPSRRKITGQCRLQRQCRERRTVEHDLGLCTCCIDVVEQAGHIAEGQMLARR
jgi:hypothetical protein